MLDVSFFLGALCTDVFTHKLFHFFAIEEACVWIFPNILDLFYLEELFGQRSVSLSFFNKVDGLKLLV
jgi:hypothetical protein